MSEEVAAERLRVFFERIESLKEEQASLTADIREVFAEAKSAGFDTKIMREVLKLRAMDPADRQEMEALVETYKRAVGL